MLLVNTMNINFYLAGVITFSFQGCKAVFFFQKINKKYKNIYIPMLYSDSLYLAASNIFSCTLRYCCNATKMHCR